MTFGYIYIIWTRECIKCREPIYKIGKTKQEGLKRFNAYPAGSSIKLHIESVDCDRDEKFVKELFKSKYKQILSYGNEYFEGNINDMKLDVMLIVEANSTYSNSEHATLFVNSIKSFDFKYFANKLIANSTCGKPTDDKPADDKPIVNNITNNNVTNIVNINKTDEINNSENLIANTFQTEPNNTSKIAKILEGIKTSTKHEETSTKKSQPNNDDVSDESKHKTINKIDKILNGIVSTKAKIVKKPNEITKQAINKENKTFIVNNTENNYNCAECGLKYSTPGGLRKHQNKFHINIIEKSTKPEKIYCCSYCDKNFNIRQSRWAHQQKCMLANEYTIDEKIKILAQEVSNLKSKSNNCIV